MPTETAILGGGCFWCVEAAINQLKGVESVRSGYMGGRIANPTYQQVCSGKTGHVEVAEVTFDPAVISFSDLLHVFFTLHDPTTLNRQGNDVGEQYRSVIFYRDEAQKKTAEDVIAELTRDKVFKEPDRHRRRAGINVLRGRGLSPGLPGQQSHAALLHVRGFAQGAEDSGEVRATAEGVAVGHELSAMANQPCFVRRFGGASFQACLPAPRIFPTLLAGDPRHSLIHTHYPT